MGNGYLHLSDGISRCFSRPLACTLLPTTFLETAVDRPGRKVYLEILFQVLNSEIILYKWVLHHFDGFPCKLYPIRHVHQNSLISIRYPRPECLKTLSYGMHHPPPGAIFTIHVLPRQFYHVSQIKVDFRVSHIRILPSEKLDGFRSRLSTRSKGFLTN